MTPYEMTFELPAQRYDSRGVLKPSAVLYLCQTAAGEHCKQFALDWDSLQQKHLFWAVIRVRAQIHQLPRVGTPIRVVTWPMPTTRSAFPRTTEGYDDQGNLLFTVTNLWVLMDTEKRAMLLPGKSGVTLDGITLGRELELPGSIHPETFANRCARQVSPEDIDRNGHMNNTRYFDWLSDLLGQTLPQIRQLQAVYQNEALPGEMLTLCWEKTDTSAALEILRPQKNAPDKFDRIFAARVEF